MRNVHGWSAVSWEPYTWIVGIAILPWVSIGNGVVQVVVNIKVTVKRVTVSAPRLQQVLVVIEFFWIGFANKEFVVVLVSTAVTTFAAYDPQPSSLRLLVKVVGVPFVITIRSHGIHIFKLVIGAAAVTPNKVFLFKRSCKALRLRTWD